MSDSATTSGPNPLAQEPTTIVGRFSNRRDAEMAANRLKEADIQSVVSADDAGGIRPDLQHIHGVRLSVLRGEVSDAIAVLVDAGWTDEAVIETGDIDGNPADEESNLLLLIAAGLAVAAALAFAIAMALGEV